MTRQGDRLINERNWVELVKPDKIVSDGENDGGHGKFICEPLERGFGTTIGNAMRRVLLSSLQGSAFVAVKISGVQHEFTTIHGVLEDITDVVLNLKQVRLSMNTDSPQRLSLNVSGRRSVKAADIATNQHVTILNPEQHIATLTEDVSLEMEFEVRMGKGYVAAEAHEGLSEEIGLIRLDASFSPVRKVSYVVEQARVGQMTNYDKLILEVWTDGSIPPDEAIAYSAKIIKDQIHVFIDFDDSIIPNGGDENTSDFDKSLCKDINDLELSVRATNCLKFAGITYVYELVRRTEAEVLKMKNFGKKSLEEIREKLDREFGLKFGMKLPPDIDMQCKAFRASQPGGTSMKEPEREIGAGKLSLRKDYDGDVDDEDADDDASDIADDDETLSESHSDNLCRKVENLELSDETISILTDAGIIHVYDLVRKTESQLLAIEDFSDDALDEVKEELAKMGLHFGSHVPDDIEQQCQD